LGRSPLALLNISVLISRSPPVVFVLPPMYVMFLMALTSNRSSVKLVR